MKDSRWKESARMHLIDDTPETHPDKIPGFDGQARKLGDRLLGWAGVVTLLALLAILAILVRCAAGVGA